MFGAITCRRQKQQTYEPTTSLIISSLPCSVAVLCWWCRVLCLTPHLQHYVEHGGMCDVYRSMHIFAVYGCEYVLLSHFR